MGGFFMNRINIIERLSSNIVESDKDKEIIEAIEDAIREWKSARTYFEFVSEPKLVDYAIYMEAAAKSRYAYLIGEARKKGITVNYNHMVTDISAV